MKKIIISIFTLAFVFQLSPLAVNAATVSVSASTPAKVATKTVVAKKKVVAKKVVKKTVIVKVYKVNPWKSVKKALPREASGVVNDIDLRAHQVVISDAANKYIFQITPDTVITRNGEVIAFDQIQTGESVVGSGAGQFTQYSIITAKSIAVKS